jgi:glycosyltransferase involved in cell wall biosynthesis
MALGLPVVASDLPGIRAFLRENCLFPVGDISRAVELMCELRDVEKHQQVVQHNRQVVLARASGASFSKAVLALTEGVLEECGYVS